MAQTAPTEIDFDDVRALVATDLDAVDQLIRSSLGSDVVLVSQVAEHIISSGGKRLRPVLVLLAARALGYTGSEHHQLAAIVEFIHTATLLHDDVVDGSDQRRGRPTANNVFGNQASVLVGDFLYSRAFQMMVALQQLPVMEILADATNTIAAGEVMQLMNVHNPETTEETYREVIYRKTARLFEAGAELGGFIAGASGTQRAALARYGRELGVAFQLVDDALDYGSNAGQIGKNIGDDLAEGKPTLPLIYAQANCTDIDREFLRRTILKGGLGEIDRVMAVIESTGALQYTAERAEEAAANAVASLDPIPESDYKQALRSIAEFSVRRSN